MNQDLDTQKTRLALKKKVLYLDLLGLPRNQSTTSMTIPVSVQKISRCCLFSKESQSSRCASPPGRRCSRC